jgi:hypothetical protein
MEEIRLLDLIVTAVLFIWALVKLGDIAQNTDAMRRDISRLVRSVESRNGPATPTIHGEEEGRPARKIYEGMGHPEHRHRDIGLHDGRSR